MNHLLKPLVVILLIAVALAAAQCPAPAEPQVIEREVEVEKEVTVVVTEEVEREVVVTATPEPAEVAVPDEPVYGGTIRASWVADITSMDPPPSWDSQSWSSHMLLYSGLLRFKPGTAEPEPDLAEAMPTISSDGLVFTYKLRDGLKFSSGRPLTAEDVKWSLDRFLAQETGAWGSSYYVIIKGAAESLAGEADTVEGIRVVDDRTIEIELVEPVSPGWVNSLMAVTWTYVVDREAVEQYGEEFRNNPAGAGPYVLAEYIPGQRAIFEKNTNYWRYPDEPYADRIEIQLGVDTNVAALKLEAGEIDLIPDPLGPAALLPFLMNPDWQPYTQQATDTGAYFIALDSSQGLTADLRVRQAIAHAIDKERLIQILGAAAIPAKSLLSPGSGEWYDPTIPEYTYNPERAKELLAEAGVAEGTEIEFVSANFYPWDVMAQAVQQDLEEIGLKASLRLVARSAWYEANAQHNPIVFNQWPLELPDPSYIFEGGFSQAAFYPDSCCNWSWYSTDAMEAALSAARTEADHQKRIEMYQALDRQVVYDEALWIPLFHMQHYVIHSPRLGGYTIPMVYGPNCAQFQHYWVTDGR